MIRNKEKAKEVMRNVYASVVEAGVKKFGKRFRLSMSAFKKTTQSSLYSPHQGERECARRVRQFSSGNLGLMGH